MDQESAYLTALESARTFEIVGFRLTLMDADGNQVLSYLGEDF